jgi:beta-N-acetylhexosaminidase
VVDAAAVEAAAGPRNPAAVLLPGFVGTTLPDWLGVCLFGQNIASPAQLRALTAAIREANLLAVIAIDEEGGDVTRLHSGLGSPYPGNAILGRIDDEEYTATVAYTVGWELRRAGCTLDFAPDVDINSNPDNPVIGRSLEQLRERALAPFVSAIAAGVRAVRSASRRPRFER